MHRPRKRFGQHFLTDRRSLERIVEALGPEATDTVVEIGPGKGALTDLLAARCGRLVAIEIDRDLAASLRDRFHGRSSVEIVEGDALDVGWAELAGERYLLAGNLPYYITTPLIFRILERPMPQRAVLLVQREVADRLLAKPGSSEYGALTVNVQVAATIAAVGRVSAGAFYPRPKVDSAIVLLRPRAAQLLGTAEERPFRQFVQAIFGMRRKTMLRIVRELWVPPAGDAATVLAAAGIDRSARPETVPPETLVQLFRLTRIHAGQDLHYGGP